MRINKLFLTIGVILVLLGAAACAQTEPAVPQTGPDDAYPGAATPIFDEEIQNNVINFLASQLNVSADQINLGNVQYMEWSDSCLGLGGADEICAQAVTPGYQVTATVDGQEYVVRTDIQALTVRLEGDASVNP